MTRSRYALVVSVLMAAACSGSVNGGGSGANAGGNGGVAGGVGGSGAVASDASPDRIGATGGGGGAVASDASADRIGAVDGGAVDAFRACPGSTASASGGCRTSSDCRAGDQCHEPGYVWPASSCPLVPCGMRGAQPPPCNAAACADGGGTCVPQTMTCPYCAWTECVLPTPQCTTSPDNCGGGRRCNPGSAHADARGCEPIPCSDAGPSCQDGYRCNPASSRADAWGCEPIPCAEGFACAAETRCNAASAVSDVHGCEMIPCNDGWPCPENTRCTAPDGGHGCTPLGCTTDRDCDCGFCISGQCYAALWTCMPLPS